MIQVYQACLETQLKHHKVGLGPLVAQEQSDPKVQWVHQVMVRRESPV